MKHLTEFKNFALLSFIAIIVKYCLSSAGIAEAILAVGLLAYYAHQSYLEFKQEHIKHKSLEQEFKEHKEKMEVTVAQLNDKISSTDSKLSVNSMARTIRPGVSNERK